MAATRSGVPSSAARDCGPWVYAQAVCRPAGARVGSATALLAEQEKRPLGQPAVGALEGGEQRRLVAADVDRSRSPGLRGSPRNRAIERPVDLHRGRAEVISGEHRAVPPGQRRTGHLQQRTGQHVGHHRAGRQLLPTGHADSGHPPALDGDPLDAGTGADTAAELLEVCHQRVGDSPRAAARARPSDGVPEQLQVEAGDRRARTGGQDVAVHRGAVQPRPRA